MADTLEAPATAPRRTSTRVALQQIRLAEQARNLWHVLVPAEHTEDDCVAPSYLWLRHDLLKTGDRVEMVHEDYKFIIEALVVKIDRETQSVFTRVINAVDFSEQAMPEADLTGATVEKTEADGWRVVLGHVVLAKGFARKPEADAWLAKRRGGVN